MYQEMESMFYLSEQDITPLYKHLSNSRAISEFDIKCYDNNYFAHRNRFNLDDAEFDVELSSDLSEGQKFSALSARLGYDYHGRAAGKVMGMASYGLEKRHDCYTPGDLAGRLQSETVDVTAKLIERLIEYKPECKNICLSGGYALNCVANYQYLDRFPNHKFFIDPCAHDGGTAIGSCVKNTFYKDTGYTI
jgi:carbamoyltransferase